MHVANPAVAPRFEGLPQPTKRWLTVPWMLAVAALWWITFDTLASDTLPSGAEVPREAIHFGVAMGLCFKLMGSLIEAGFYAGWWAMRNARASFGALWTWLFSLSLLDALAALLPWAIEPEGRVASIGIALLCGPQALSTPGQILGDPLLRLFGVVGLITIARIAFTAWVQARAIGRTIAGPLGVTAVAWFMVRIVTWWLGDLLRGQSAAMIG